MVSKIKASLIRRKSSEFVPDCDPSRVLCTGSRRVRFPELGPYQNKKETKSLYQGLLEQDLICLICTSFKDLPKIHICDKTYWHILSIYCKEIFSEDFRRSIKKDPESNDTYVDSCWPISIMSGWAQLPEPLLVSIFSQLTASQVTVSPNYFHKFNLSDIGFRSSLLPMVGSV